MSEYERRFIRVPILVPFASPLTCNQASSGAEDGCDAFVYDDEGDAFCGAFAEFLKQVDEDENRGRASHVRCASCIKGEIL